MINVYDLTGNFWEWTLALYSQDGSNRVLRSGDFNDVSTGFPANQRLSGAVTMRSTHDSGARAILYLK